MSAKVTRWRRFVGDTDSIKVQLTGIDVLAPSAVVVAHLIRNGNADQVNGSVTNAGEFEVTIPLTTWLATAIVGLYELRIVVDDVTWPERGTAEVEVSQTPA
jgi:hypothetical protein